MTGSRQYILVIDDDPLIGKICEAALSLKVTAITEGFFTFDYAALSPPFAIILDVSLGFEGNGIDLIDKLRTTFPESPIIVMTSNQDPQIVAAALHSGAQDFVNKPIRGPDVNARVVVRRQQLLLSLDKDTLRLRAISLHPRQRRLHGPTGDAWLGPKELLALELLIRAKFAEVSRTQLIFQVWKQTKISPNSVDQLIKRLRTALEEVGADVTLNSVYGGKLKLTPSEASDAPGENPEQALEPTQEMPLKKTS